MPKHKYDGRPLEKIGNTTIIEDKDGYYWVAVPQKDGTIRLEHVEKGPKDTDTDKVAKFTRRSFLASGLAGTGYIYYKYAWDPMRYLGRAAEAGLEISKTVRDMSKETVEKIVSRLDLETKLEKLEEQHEISEALLARFREIYSDQHELYAMIRRLKDDADQFNMQFNEFAKKTPASMLSGTEYDRTHKKIYESIQNLTGKNTEDKNYIMDFREVRRKQKELVDSIKDIETRIARSIDKEDYIEAEHLMHDYIALHAAQQQLCSIVKDEGIGKIIKEEMKSIDRDLEAKLGRDYMRYVDAYNKGIKIEKIMPITGAIGTLAAASYVLRPVSRYIAEPISKMIAYASKKKRAYSKKNFINNLLKQYGNDKRT